MSEPVPVTTTLDLTERDMNEVALVDQVERLATHEAETGEPTMLVDNWPEPARAIANLELERRGLKSRLVSARRVTFHGLAWRADR